LFWPSLFRGANQALRVVFPPKKREKSLISLLKRSFPWLNYTSCKQEPTKSEILSDHQMIF